MNLGMIGLGRMGASLVRRLSKDGHQCVVHDIDPAVTGALTGPGITAAGSLEKLVAQLAPPRVVWVMLPAGVVGQTVSQLAACLADGDIIIDGGNSYYRDDIARAHALKASGIHYVDCGTSGGVFGLDRGFCLMIGGEEAVVNYLEPIFRSIAPGIDCAPRTPGRQGAASAVEQGYLHCGPSGAGHFVKMVHNGIEYAVMAAYAEGLNILKSANVGKRPLHGAAADAETAPMRDPAFYQYDMDLPQIAEVWRRGSVIGSWLLDLTAASLLQDPELANFSGRVSDSGEGRWTIAAAIDEAVPVPVLSAALFERFSSRGEADFSNRVLSAMRKTFGGHDEKKEKS